MDLKILKHICFVQAHLLNIPIRINLNKTVVESYSNLNTNLNVDFADPHIEQLFSTRDPINYFVTSDLLIFGLVKDKNSPYSVIIGPGRLLNVSKSALHKIIVSKLYPLKFEQLPDLMNYIEQLPKTDIRKFLHILSLMNAAINQKIVSPDKMIKYDTGYCISEEIDREMVKKDENLHLHGLARRNNRQIETELLFCIKHGLSTQIQKLEKKYGVVDIGVLGADNLRHMKNAGIILNSLALRTAISGGLAPEICYQLGEIYIQKIESCTTVEQVSSVISTLQTDYCERVRKVIFGTVDDPLIKKAMSFIEENIYRDISISDVANHLKFSKNYLSSRFKKLTGISLNNYINKQKILEAKRLISLTDKPLIDISEYLSFSSQSYFQNMFKKYEGITPGEYRKNKSQAAM